MATKPDITVNLPAEHFNALSEVISTGIQRAKLDPQTRQQLRDWWAAERDYILDELPSVKSNE